LGRPRYTGDLDVFVEATEENAEKVSRALRAFGHEGAADAAHEFSSPGKMMTLGVEPVRIDITTEMSDLSFDEAWRGRSRCKLFGKVVPFLGKEQYIKNKLAASKNERRRAKDLSDIALLERVDRAKAPRRPRR
jgi:hypothetical protein